MKNSSTTLTEQLIRQSLNTDISRLILTVQNIVINISDTLQDPDQQNVSQQQLLSQCNQVWLDKIVKSAAVHMILTRCATSVIEVDQEHQGDLVLAVDPLSCGAVPGTLAASSFAAWRYSVNTENVPGCFNIFQTGNLLYFIMLKVYRISLTLQAKT